MTANFIQLWLKILCQGLPEATSAIFVLLDGESQNIQPLAKWPENLNDIDDFKQVIKYALIKKEKVSVLNVQHPGISVNYDYFALPILIQPELSGAIVFKVEHTPADRHEAFFNLLEQGEQWLALADIRQDENVGFYVSLLRLLATCIEQKSYREALIGLVAELTQSLNCERVAFGEFENQNSKVVALSNSAQFDVRSNFMQKIADAMDEAIEQDCHIVFPNTHSTHIERAHQELARKFGSGSLLTIPLINGVIILVQ